MNNKKFVIRAIAYTLAILAFLSLVVFLWDPYSYYRIRDNRIRYVASAYIDAGLIKNAEYDCAIIGSSMSQNFNPQTFRELLGVSPIKACTGGLTLEQRDLFYDCIERTEDKEGKTKTDKYFVEIALSSFNAPDDDMEDTPLYLYDDTPWNDYRYLLGYETWLRGMPVSIGYTLAEILGVKMDTLHNVQSIDNVGDWYTRYELGRERVIKKYENKIDAISEQNTDGMYARMRANVDRKLTAIIDDENEYVMFFPPYSALFWRHAALSGYSDCYLDIKQYMIETLDTYDNVRVYDFQSAPFITDLDNYRDTSHYGRHINELMTESFATGEHLTDALRAGESRKKLEEIAATYAF